MRPLSLTIDSGIPLIANWEFRSGIALESEDSAVTTIVAAFAHAKEIKLHTSNLAGEPIDAVFDGPASDAGLEPGAGDLWLYDGRCSGPRTGTRRHAGPMKLGRLNHVGVATPFNRGFDCLLS